MEKDNTRKNEVEKVVKPLIGKIDGKTAIIDIPGVREIIKDAYIFRSVHAKTKSFNENNP